MADLILATRLAAEYGFPIKPVGPCPEKRSINSACTTADRTQRDLRWTRQIQLRG